MRSCYEFCKDMRRLYQEGFIFLLVFGIVISANISNKNSSNDVDASYQYEDYNEDIYDKDDEVLNIDRPCPRDCICETTTGSTVARCNRLEAGTQKFGRDITDLVVENSDKKHPIMLNDMIFKTLGLEQVINIRISNSIIKFISPVAFVGLNELYSVNLSNNKIENIDPHTFNSNTELYLLSLSNNPLVLNNYTDFLISKSIQELDISNCNLTNVPLKTFQKMENLMYINLSGNKLTDINERLFSNLEDLEEVDLSNNFLKSIPNGLFSNNSEMTTLNIGKNPITTVKGLKIAELLTLNLSNGSVKTVGPAMFDEMRYIANLNLSNNEIQKIYDSSFSVFSELNYLDLSNNKLDTLSENLIHNNVQLDILKISNNILLKNLPLNGFKCTESHFNIYLFDASGCSLEIIPEDFFKTMTALTQLNLAKNKIYSLGSSLQKTERLLELDLSYNSIETLDKTTFAKNMDLAKLNLAGNPIVTLSTEIFSNNGNLNWLDLSSCQLFQLWENGDNHPENVLKKLSYLNVSNNQLSALHPSELQMINKLNTLDISQNPLQCTEDFEKLMRWLGENHVSPAKYEKKISNLGGSDHRLDKSYSWQFLALQVCGTTTSTTAISIKSDRVESSDEIMWKKIDESTPKDKNGDYIIDDDQEDDYVYESEEFADDKNETSTSDEIDKMLFGKKDKSVTNDLSKTTIFENDKNHGRESDNDEEDEIFVMETVSISSSENVDYWKNQILFATYIMGFFILLLACVLIIKILRRKVSRAQCNIGSLTTHGRIKNCGQVYQPLSEDLTEPKTPILKKQTIIGNMTNVLKETNPFYQKVNPEVV